MRYSLAILIVFLVSGHGPAFAQADLPSVAEIIKKHDRNQDGMLTSEEVANSRYARQFPRWDKNRDGKVTAADIVTFRRQFGIAADGSRLPAQKATFTIPDVDDLPRVDRNQRPTPSAARNSAYILRTRVHDVAGDDYIVLTDHTEDTFLSPLRRLATHRHGTIIQVADLATLYKQKETRARLRKQLSHAKYVAIAPRQESFRENMLLGMWELLSTLDDDAQIDVLPGFLLASDEQSFVKLIAQSMTFRPLSAEAVKPLAISQVQRVSETRSLQKAGILRKQFAKTGHETPVVAIYGKQAEDAPKLAGDKTWNLTAPGQQKFVREFPEPVTRAFAEATLWVLHGHGIPGMSCSVDVDGLPDDLSGKILLSGSCFAAAPWQSDLPQMRQAPGGYQVKQRDAFIIRAVDRGAVVAFGHQRLSAGFPHLYPVLEAWKRGQTVGQAYQQLLNALIDLQQTKPGGFVISDAQKKQQRHPQNRLLYVIIGDPALQPMEPLN